MGAAKPPTQVWNLAVSADGAELDVTLYGVIGADWFSESTDKQIADQLAAHRGARSIRVHINSEGGDMFAGIAIYNMLVGHGAEVTSIVEGLAASAASIVAMAGKTVMGRGAMLMVHNPWALAMGDADDLRHVADVLDRSKSSLVSIYEKKTGKTAEELEALLNAETWLTAEEALAQGFADEIAGDVPIPVEAEGDTVLVSRIPFPRGDMPAQILAMLPPGREGARPLSRDSLSASAPELLAALLAEGHAAGVKAERARLQAIDALGNHGDLSTAAKYGEPPGTSETLALVILKSEKQSGLTMLADRRRESLAARVDPNMPERVDEARDRRAIEAITDGGNARRGGKRR